MKLLDPICKFCGNNCKQICIWLKDVNGNTARKEALFSDVCKSVDVADNRNYNDKLAELINDKEIDFDRIVFIQPYKLRAIAACLYVDIPKKNIAQIMHISLSDLCRKAPM
jgi:hypothetical protein